MRGIMTMLLLLNFRGNCAIVYTKGDTEHVINYTDTTESKTINVF